MNATLNLTASPATPVTFNRKSRAMNTVTFAADAGTPAAARSLLSSAFESDVVKNLAAGAAALALTAAFGLAFVQSTHEPPGARMASSAPAHVHLAKLSVHRGHAWFGQAEPAVLVD